MESIKDGEQPASVITISKPNLGMEYESFFHETPLHASVLVANALTKNTLMERWEPTVPKTVTLHCSNKRCGGLRLHHAGRRELFFFNGAKSYVSAHFTCANCQTEVQHFIFSAEADLKLRNSAILTKVYQSPAFGKPIPKKLFEVIGEENRKHFLNARRSIARGLGIGAFTYYRRIIENHKFALVAAVLKVAKNGEAKPGMIEKLEAALKETQFSKAIDMLKEADAIPSILLIMGHNPLTLLHDTLSEGIHANTDEDCLERAQEAEIILFELSERIQVALAQKKELNEALTKMIARSGARGGSVPKK